MRPEAVIFDLDGTLADSFAGIAHALNGALREMGLPERDLIWVKYHVGYGAGNLVRAAVGESAAEELVQHVGRRFGTLYEESYLQASPPLPGALEVVQWTWEKTSGKVAVLSNKYATLTRPWLEHWGFAPYVAHVVGPDNAGARKPDPRIFGTVWEALGVAPEDALYVGDMEVDVDAGRAAGVPTVALAGPSRTPAELWAAGAFYVLEDLRDLRGFLAEYGEGWQD